MSLKSQTWMFHPTSTLKKRPKRWVSVSLTTIFLAAFAIILMFFIVPIVPLPETPIDVTDCRLNLLLHIGDMQNEVNTRLESLEGLFEGGCFH